MRYWQDKGIDELDNKHKLYGFGSATYQSIYHYSNP
jgi:hypothetical protein